VGPRPLAPGALVVLGPLRVGGLRHRLAVAAGAVALAAVLAVPAAAAGRGAPVQEPTTTVPAGPTSPEDLAGALDLALSSMPATSCLAVSVGEQPLHRVRADRPLVPASNLKLLTASIALDVLGEDHRFTTRVVTPTAPVDGVVSGDLFLVGGGDPLLSTDLVRLLRKLDDAQHPTSLDALADAVADAGIRRITGRVVGDESRYDRARSVATWPERYLDQEQSGPLSALTVDDGYRYEAREGSTPARRRAERPASAAAATFAGLLRARGVDVGGGAAEGAAPGGAVELAAVDGAPLAGVLAELLTFSDNQTGELLLKEIGLVGAGAGTTEAGRDVVRSRAEALGLVGASAVVTDGSGLDTGNRLTCDDLITMLDTSGPDGTVGQGLAVAARTGTLRNRLDDPALAGTLRAKTGNLRQVTSLAGFVPTASGELATFAMIVNGVDDPETVWTVQTAVARVLAAYHLVCAPVVRPPLLLSGGLYAGSMGTLAMFPLQSAVLPGTVVPLHVFEDRYRSLVDRCVAADEDFGIVLISRGREVGGDDERTDVGARMRILRTDRGPDGRILLVAGAISRLRVRRWLADDPHPWADVEDWPDPEPEPTATARVEATAAELRSVLALRRELGDPVPSTVDLDLAADPARASWALARLLPASAYDRQRLLVADDVERRLDVLDELLADQRLVAEAQLRGA